MSIKLDIRSYKTHDPPLECKIALDYVQKCKDSKLQPYVAASTADTGAQANILNKLGLNIGCLHRSATIMDCANSSQPEVIGAFLGCIRGSCEITGRTMVNRSMVYVIEGDIILLSQTALRDLGVISKEFPRIGQFKGTVQKGDGMDMIQTGMFGGKFGIKYIAPEVEPQPEL